MAPTADLLTSLRAPSIQLAAQLGMQVRLLQHPEPFRFESYSLSRTTIRVFCSVESPTEDKAQEVSDHSVLGKAPSFPDVSNDVSLTE